jgi:hypothetical protein
MSRLIVEDHSREEGEAMYKNLHGFIRLKTWLFRHQVSDWGEGVTEGIFFGLIAWGVWKGAGG